MEDFTTTVVVGESLHCYHYNNRGSPHIIQKSDILWSDKNNKFLSKKSKDEPHEPIKPQGEFGVKIGEKANMSTKTHFAGEGAGTKQQIIMKTKSRIDGKVLQNINIRNEKNESLVSRGLYCCDFINAGGVQCSFTTTQKKSFEDHKNHRFSSSSSHDNLLQIVGGIGGVMKTGSRANTLKGFTTSSSVSALVSSSSTKSASAK